MQQRNSLSLPNGVAFVADHETHACSREKTHYQLENLVGIHALFNFQMNFGIEMINCTLHLRRLVPGVNHPCIEAARSMEDRRWYVYSLTLESHKCDFGSPPRL